MASQTVASDRETGHQRQEDTGDGEVNEIHDFPFRIELFGTVMLGIAVSKDSKKGTRGDKGLIKTLVRQVVKQASSGLTSWVARGDSRF